MNSKDVDKRKRWNQRYTEREWVWSLSPTRSLVEAVAELPTGKALDAGAGEGRNSIWLASRGWQVTAVDFSSVGVNKGRAIAEHQQVHIDWRCEDIANFLPEPGSLDLIIWVYMHIPNQRRQEIWQELLPGLAAGGHFIYIGHDPGNIGRQAGGPQDADVLASTESVVSDLRGHQIVCAEVLERPFEQDPGHGGNEGAVALDALVHAIW